MQTLTADVGNLRYIGEVAGRFRCSTAWKDTIRKTIPLPTPLGEPPQTGAHERSKPMAQRQNIPTPTEVPSTGSEGLASPSAAELSAAIQTLTQAAQALT